MTSTEILDRLHDLGITVQANGPKVRLEPASKVPADLLNEVRAHKAEIIQELRQPYGDGQPPPPDRPPATEQELRRLMDHLADPTNFSAWLDRVMDATDPAEAPEGKPQRWNP